jgi:hypothetical protein
MKKVVGDVFVLLVCNDDGIVILTFDEYTQIIDGAPGGTEWVSATRNRGKCIRSKGLMES